MTIRVVTAFCPGHISGYFQRIEGDTPATTGSTGAGIVISEGVTATLTPSTETTVKIIREHLDGTPREVIEGSPLLISAMERLSIHACIETRCHLPIGAGFGLSAAALLASLSAANRLYDLGLSRQEIAGYAHNEEVLHKTGLGDVAACQGGGIAIRKSPGIRGDIERWESIPGPLYAATWGPIPTPSVLSSKEQMTRVALAYPSRYPHDFTDFFHLCREFDKKSGLVTPEVTRAFETCDGSGILSAMTMLGNGVVAYGSGAGKILEKFGEVFELMVAEKGPVVLREDP